LPDLPIVAHSRGVGKPGLVSYGFPWPSTASDLLFRLTCRLPVNLFTVLWFSEVIAMPTTVYFASNRILTGNPEVVASYGPNIQPPSVSTGITYGTAFVDGINLATDQQGTITSIQNTNQGSFAANVIGDLSTPGRNLLVFVHGFDNTFEDAITRAAVNREFLAASGLAGTDTSVIAFSWPSLGQIVSFPVLDADYRHDQNMARQSGIHMMTFLANLEPLLRTARANACRTYLLAHSMGNLALQSGVENWFLHGNGNASLFDAAILAAGDCGFDAFGQPNLSGLAGLSLLTPRIAIYYSGADDVLQLSNRVNGLQRLGQDGPQTRTDPAEFPAATYRMFDASAVLDYNRGFLSSHQYYRLSPTVRAQIATDMTP
jgi:esterase/lipase superfamily enzyme